MPYLINPLAWADGIPISPDRSPTLLLLPAPIYYPEPNQPPSSSSRQHSQDFGASFVRQVDAIVAAERRRSRARQLIAEARAQAGLPPEPNFNQASTVHMMLYMLAWLCPIHTLTNSSLFAHVYLLTIGGCRADPDLICSDILVNSSSINRYLVRACFVW